MGCGASKEADKAGVLEAKSVVPAPAVKTEATSAAPAAPSTVAGKETTFIEIGAGGAPVRSGSDKPLEEVEQILVVVDPRALPNMVAAKELLAANVRAKMTAFLLLPSTTSSPGGMLCAEVALQARRPSGKSPRKPTTTRATRSRKRIS
jgi:hypothetical protein